MTWLHYTQNKNPVHKLKRAHTSKHVILLKILIILYSWKHNDYAYLPTQSALINLRFQLLANDCVEIM